MQEIKFRAWDKEKKQMLFVTFEFLMAEKSYFRDALRYKKYILMQYTGLKDKNGKEIYEGDICKFHSFMENKTKIADVIYIDGCFELSNSELVKEVLEEYVGLEIIGNIYENKELLKCSLNKKNK